MDTVIAALELNEKNGWSGVAVEHAFHAFLNAASIHECENASTVLPEQIQTSCLPSGAISISIPFSDDEIDDGMLEVLKDPNNDTGKYLVTSRVLILCCLRCQGTVEEKLFLCFQMIERVRGKGVLLEQLKDWIEDACLVVSKALQSWKEKELHRETDISSTLSLNLVVKRQNEAISRSIEWMRGKMEQQFENYFKTERIPLAHEKFVNIISEVMHIWSIEALDSVENAFEKSKTYESFAEKIENPSPCFLTFFRQTGHKKSFDISNVHAPRIRKKGNEASEESVSTL